MAAGRGLGMSAAEIETNETGMARRDLMLADIAIVQKQNINWLSRRFGFQYELAEFLASRGGKALGLGLSRLDLMPTWRRWPTLIYRAMLGRDGESRERIRTAFDSRLRRQRPGAVLQPIQAVDSNAIDEAALHGLDRALRRAEPTPTARSWRAGSAAGAVPAIEVIIRFGPADLGRLGAIVAELQAQLLEGWRAQLVVPEDVAAAQISLLGAAADRRITVTTGATLPGAGWIVFAEPNVVLRPETLFGFAAAAGRDNLLALIYADEDRLDAGGKRNGPWFKPRFSPELNHRRAYLGDCVCVAAAVCPRSRARRPSHRRLGADGGGSARGAPCRPGGARALSRHR